MDLPGRLPGSRSYGIERSFRYDRHFSKSWDERPGGFWCEGDGEYELVQYVISSGAAKVRHRCLTCGRMMTFDLPYTEKEARQFPLYRDKSGSAPRCERCNRCGTEDHHWAPQAVFLDADTWPTSRLCRACHREWHEVMRIAGAPYRAGET